MHQLAITALAVATLSVGATAHAQTVLFQQGLNGYAAQFDTNLRGEDPTVAFGSAEEISVDASDGGFPSQGLLRFDNVFGNGAGQIGSGFVVVSATLTLNITSAGSGIQFHEMLQAWNADTITWDSAVGGIQADGVEAATSALISLGANDGSGNIGDGPLVIDFTNALQRMQAGTGGSLGWALLPWLPDGTNGVDFYSADWSGVVERPLLTVQIAAVPEPGVWALWLAGLGVVGSLARRRHVG